jgi:hypothetical protein
MLVQAIKTGNTPRAIAIAPDGKIYIANHMSVTSFFPDGKPYLPPLKHQNPETIGDLRHQIQPGFKGAGTLP